MQTSRLLLKGLPEIKLETPQTLLYTAATLPSKTLSADDGWSDEEPRKPLVFLSSNPFPGSSLYIDGSPVAIIDTAQFDEDTEDHQLTTAIGIATILWNWHPNALRAFLDIKRYPDIEFAICDKISKTQSLTHVITRHSQSVVIGTFNQDRDWEIQCGFGMPRAGAWKPLSGAGAMGSVRQERVSDLGHFWARDQLYHRRWKPWEHRTHELYVGEKRGVDPSTLY